MMRLLRYGLALLGLFLVGNLIFAASLVWPGWAFAYHGGTERLRIHAATPVPEAATAWADTLLAELDAGALPPGDVPVDLYVTGDGWRYRWFFAGAPGAGGLIYAGAPGGKVFLAGADFAADRLVMPDRVLPPPRTLSYYAQHEITHLTQIEILGRTGFYRMEPVMREGIADWVALGPASLVLQAVVAERGNGQVDADLRDAYGAYPTARVTVTKALESQELSELLRATR